MAEKRIIEMVREGRGGVTLDMALGELAERGVDTAGVAVERVLAKLDIGRDKATTLAKIKALKELIGAIGRLDETHPERAREELDAIFTEENVERLINSQRHWLGRMLGMEGRPGWGTSGVLTVAGGIGLETAFRQYFSRIQEEGGKGVTAIAESAVKTMEGHAERAGEALDALAGASGDLANTALKLLGREFNTTTEITGSAGDAFKSTIQLSTQVMVLSQLTGGGSDIVKMLKFLTMIRTYVEPGQLLLSNASDFTIQSGAELLHSTVTQAMNTTMPIQEKLVSAVRFGEILGSVHARTATKISVETAKFEANMGGLVEAFSLADRTIGELEYIAWLLMIFLVIVGLIWLFMKGWSWWDERQTERYFEVIQSDTGHRRLRGTHFRK